MAKYKVGDKVRIVSNRPSNYRFVDSMEKYLGKTLTVSRVVERLSGAFYQFEEAKCSDIVLPLIKTVFPDTDGKWTFSEEWITGLVQPAVRDDSDLSVVIRFHGKRTVARLMRGDTIAKTAVALQHPEDKYSRQKGAMVAVERLFQKKAADKPVKFRDVKIGDKFIVTGDSDRTGHFFRKGSIVTATALSPSGSVCCENAYGLEQYVSRFDLKPYKEKSK